MNLVRTLHAPWVAANGSMRWIAGSGIVLSIAVAVVLRIFAAADNVTAAVFSLAPMVGLLWMFFLPNMLVLTFVAHRLCVPHMRQDVIAAFGLYAVLTVVLPAVVLGAVGANLATALLVLALCAGGGMLYATAPWWFSAAAPFVLIVLPHLPSTWALSPPGTAGFVRWAVPASVVLLLADVLRWHQLQRVNRVPVRGIRRAMIFGLNSSLRAAIRGDGALATAVGMNDPAVLLRQRPDRLQPEVDLRGSGPRHPVRALRIALGGWYLPVTWRSRVRRSIPTLWPLVFIVIILLVVAWSMRTSDLARLIVGGPTLTLLDFYVVLTAAIVPLSITTHVRRMWRRTNTQLPLLALLPGLGDATRTRDELIRAMLLKPLHMLVITFAILLASAWYAALPLSPAVFLILVPVLWAAVLVVGMLQIVSGTGRTEQWCFLWVISPACFILTCFSVVLPSLAAGALTPSGTAHLAGDLAAAWCALGIWLATLGRRGWRRLCARPHPFLANAP